MSNNSVWRVIASSLVLLSGIGFYFTSPVNAAAPLRVELEHINTEQFPQISAYLNVFDVNQRFVTGLQAEDVLILEDDQPVQGVTLNQASPGAQFVLALNPGPPFIIRNSQGISRFDTLYAYLLNWARSNTSTNDDYSLMIADGPEALHLSSPAEWLGKLESYQLDAQNLSQSFDIVGRAIDVAAETTVRPGMKRVVLLVTSPPIGSDATVIQDLIARANQQEVHIFIWMVASADYFASEAANLLTSLAVQTGGQIFMFSGSETLPDIDAYLQAYRHTYLLTYQSAVRATGKHKVVAQVNYEGETFRSDELVYEINIEAPRPVFVSPPVEIVRTLTKNAENAAEGLVPSVQPLQIIIEFPDNMPRPLTRTALYLDGNLIDENTQPPFDRFSWDLTSHNAEEEHTLKVEAQDQFGLTGVSLETPVRIKIKASKAGLLSVLARQSGRIAAVAIVLVGALLGWVLIVGGRIQPKNGLDGRSSFHNRWLRKVSRSRRSGYELDPVTQPVSLIVEYATQSNGNGNKPTSDGNGHGGDRGGGSLIKRIAGFNRPQRGIEASAYAYLIQINGDAPSSAASSLAVKEAEVTLGSDAGKAKLVISDPSVCAVHARLIRGKDGALIVKDLGSRAGTWVNYAPVSAEGARLEHGDLLHLGRAGFRVNYVGSAQKPRTVVIRYSNN